MFATLMVTFPTECTFRIKFLPCMLLRDETNAIIQIFQVQYGTLKTARNDSSFILYYNIFDLETMFLCKKLFSHRNCTYFRVDYLFALQSVLKVSQTFQIGTYSIWSDRGWILLASKFIAHSVTMCLHMDIRSECDTNTYMCDGFFGLKYCFCGNLF